MEKYIKQGESLPTSSKYSLPTHGLHNIPALWPALIIAAGIWLGRLQGVSLVVAGTCWLLLILFLLVSSQFHARNKPVWPLASAVTMLFTGILLSLLFNRTLACKRSYIDSAEGPVALMGMALEPGRLVPGWYGAPERLEFGFQVQAHKSGDESTWSKVSYRVVALIENPGAVEVEGGQQLSLAADLEPLTGYANPGGFDWREYSGRRMIVGTARVHDGTHLRFPVARVSYGPLTSLRHLAAKVHTRFYRLHQLLYPDPLMRSVANAVLLGDRRALSSRLRGWFAQSGTVHVLVVSGLHLGFIAAAVYLLLGLFLGRGYTSAFLACAILLGYALATGARPPVMRAWLLVSFALFALPAARQRHVLNSLAVAFMLLLLVNPSWLSDAGFQLSFAAVAGIGMGMPAIERITSNRDWWKVRLWRWLFRLTAVCAVAQFAVAPLVAFHFGRFTPVAFIANPPVVMLAGLAVIGGFLADLTAIIWFDAGQMVALCVTYILAVMTALARWFSSFQWSSLDVPIPGFTDLVFYWLVFWLAIKLAARNKQYAWTIVLVLLLWFNHTLWWPVLGKLNRSMEVTFLDMGETTSPVVRFPGGPVLLADPSGGGPLSNWSAKQIAEPYLRRHHGRRLDWVLLRGGSNTSWRWTTAVLDNFSPDAMIIIRNKQIELLSAEIRSYCKRKHIDIHLATAGDTLEVNGAQLFFSEKDLIPVLEYRGQAVILAGESSVNNALELKKSFEDILPVVIELADVNAIPDNLIMEGTRVVTAAGGSGHNKANLLETGSKGAVRFRVSSGKIGIMQNRR